MALQLFIIRHGETAWSLSGRHTSRTELALSENGEREVSRLAELLISVQFTHVLTSPRRRACRTCELFGLLSRAKLDPELTEWDYGDYEGRQTDDIHRLRPTWNLFRDGCPHGDSPAQISERADRLMDRLRALDGNVALFTHGHFGRVLGARWIGFPVIAAQHLLCSTASLGILCYEHGRIKLPSISLWNFSPTDSPVCLPEKDISRATVLRQGAIDRWENEGGEIPKESTARIEDAEEISHDLCIHGG